MATVEFANGKRVEFDGTPTPEDIDYVASQLGITPENQNIRQPSGMGTIGRAASAVGGFAKKAGQTLLSPVVGLAATPTQLLAKAVGAEDPFKRGVPVAGLGEVPVSELGVKQKLGDIAQTAAYAMPAATIPRLAVAGALAGGGAAASKGADISKIAEQSAIGGALGGTLGLGMRVVQGLPSYISRFTDIPEKAYETAFKKGPEVRKMIREGITAQQPFETAQTATRNLRTKLSSEWQQGLQGLVEKYTGQRTSLGKIAPKLLKVADEFDIDLPQNVNNVSLNEAVDLLKQLNDIPKGSLALSPRGATARKVLNDTRDIVINNFGGKGGDVSQFYQNYAVKKKVFDAANELVRAYQTGKPISQTTARNRLMTVFNEDKDLYLKAIQDLEEQMGVDILGKVAAAKFTPTMGPADVMLASGLRQPKDILSDLVTILVSPLLSPRRSLGFVRTAKVAEPIVRTTAGVLSRTGAGTDITSSLIGPREQ